MPTERRLYAKNSVNPEYLTKFRSFSDQKFIDSEGINLMKSFLAAHDQEQKNIIDDVNYENAAVNIVNVFVNVIAKVKSDPSM
jgi:hypothetical protein